MKPDKTIKIKIPIKMLGPAYDSNSLDSVTADYRSYDYFACGYFLSWIHMNHPLYCILPNSEEQSLILINDLDFSVKDNYGYGYIIYKCRTRKYNDIKIALETIKDMMDKEYTFLQEQWSRRIKYMPDLPVLSLNETTEYQV